MKDAIIKWILSFVVFIGMLAMLFGLMLLSPDAEANVCVPRQLNVSPCYIPEKIHSVPVIGTAFLAIPGILWMLFRRK